MKVLANFVAATAIVLATAGGAYASLADQKAATVAAMLERNLELRAEAAAIASTIPSLPVTQQGAARAEVRMLQTRALQLTSLARIVPRYNQARLDQIISYFGLTVSPN